MTWTKWFVGLIALALIGGGLTGLAVEVLGFAAVIVCWPACFAAGFWWGLKAPV